MFGLSAPAFYRAAQKMSEGAFLPILQTYHQVEDMEVFVFVTALEGAHDFIETGPTVRPHETASQR